jgi:hypothetical protein
VAEVQESEIEKVHNQDHLSPPEVSTNKEHDECELEKVVKDKVTSNSCCGLDMFTLVREKVPQVYDLEKEEGEPGRLAKQIKARRAAYQ